MVHVSLEKLDRLGRRPIVRGVAMNPVDHPHGGGEGRTKAIALFLTMISLCWKLRNGSPLELRKKVRRVKTSYSPRLTTTRHELKVISIFESRPSST